MLDRDRRDWTCLIEHIVRDDRATAIREVSRRQAPRLIGCAAGHRAVEVDRR